MWSQPFSKLNAAPYFLPKIIQVSLVAMLVLLAISAAEAQCSASPSGQTAVRLKNSSNHLLTFHIDGIGRGGVPPGQRAEFEVQPGQHLLVVEARVHGQIAWTSRLITIPVAHVCTWAIKDAELDRVAMDQDRWRHNPPNETVTLVIPN